jgi:hypothetical protein
MGIMSDSTLYTIGTALNRAKDQGLTVQVLVEGQWLDGRVAATDGHGLVLAAEGFEQSVIRMQSISAVRVFSAAPTTRAHAHATAAPNAQQMPAQQDSNVDHYSGRPELTMAGSAR